MSRQKEKVIAIAALLALAVFPLVASPRIGGEVKNISSSAS